METKHLLALVLLAGATAAATVGTLVSRRLRDLAFLAVVAGSVLADRGDINLWGEYWYRGTSRGIGLSMIDGLAFAVLAGCWLAPHHPRRKGFRPAGVVLFLAYFAYAAVSAATAAEPRFAVWELANIPRALLVMLAGAAYVRTRREIAVVVLGLVLAVGLEGVFALKQRFLDGMYRPPGTLDHANSLSMYLCLVAPVLLAAALSDLPRVVRVLALGAVGVAAGAELLTLSRMGLPAFALVVGGTLLALTRWRLTLRKVLVATLLGVVTAAVLARSWEQLTLRFGSASLAEEYLEVKGENRGVYWRWAWMMALEEPWGVGLNNWSQAVSRTYGERLGFSYEDYGDIRVSPEKADLPSIRYAPPAHSLAALTLGELGWAGLLLFGLVWARWFQVGAGFLRERLDPEVRYRLGVGILFGTFGIFLQGLTEWTYRQPALFLTFHLLLGALASLHHARIQPRRATGDRTVWAGARGAVPVVSVPA